MQSNGKTKTDTASFVWSPVDGSISYHLWVDRAMLITGSPIVGDLGSDSVEVSDEQKKLNEDFIAGRVWRKLMQQRRPARQLPADQ